MLNQLMSHTTSQKNKQTDLNRTCEISLCHTQQDKKTNKQASTEHAKSAYVTRIKPKKQAKRLQQKMLNQFMSHKTN
jgi:hypothetical protein